MLRHECLRITVLRTKRQQASAEDIATMLHTSGRYTAVSALVVCVGICVRVTDTVSTPFQLGGGWLSAMQDASESSLLEVNRLSSLRFDQRTHGHDVCLHTDCHKDPAELWDSVLRSRSLKSSERHAHRSALGEVASGVNLPLCKFSPVPVFDQRPQLSHSQCFINAM